MRSKKSRTGRLNKLIQIILSPGQMDVIFLYNLGICSFDTYRTEKGLFLDFEQVLHSFMIKSTIFSTKLLVLVLAGYYFSKNITSTKTTCIQEAILE